MADRRKKKTTRPNPLLATRRLAEAETRKAAAEADRLRAQADAAREMAQIDRAKRDASTSNRAYQIGLSAGLPALGIAVGHAMAKSIERRHVAARTAANASLQRLAAEVGKAKGNPAKLAGVVRAADKTGVTRPHGPGRLLAAGGRLGLWRAALLAGEGLYVSRVMAPQARAAGSEETARVMESVGTSSLAAASTIVGERAIHLSTSAHLPAARSVAAIEAARASLASPVPKPTPKNAPVLKKAPAAAARNARAAAQVAAKTVAKEAAPSAATRIATRLARGGGRGLALGLLIAGGAALASKVAGSSSAEAAPAPRPAAPPPPPLPLKQSWVRDGRVVMRNPAYLAKLQAGRSRRR